MKNMIFSRVVSVFVTLFMIVSVSDIFINKFIIPTELEALSTSEITDAITNLKNTRYPEGYCWYNEYPTDSAAIKIFNGSQCVGFSRNMANLIFGCFPNTSVQNVNDGTVNNGWKAIKNVSSVQPGDIIHVYNHAAMVYYLNGDTIYVTEAWGSSGNTIHYGYFNGNSKNSTLAKIKANNTFYGIWRYNGTSSNTSDTKPYIKITDYSQPTGTLTPGKFFGIKGIISAYPKIEAVYGGVYNADGTYFSDEFYYQDFPGTTTYDLSKTFDKELIFNNLPIGYYRYIIYGRYNNGVNVKLIDSSFQVGNP